MLSGCVSSVKDVFVVCMIMMSVRDANPSCLCDLTEGCNVSHTMELVREKVLLRRWFYMSRNNNNVKSFPTSFILKPIEA